jgi:cob(I)alamin adenosyltransferase
MGVVRSGIKMPRKISTKSELGMIHVYTGDGKGKTTAALGLALRASGHGFHVAVIQFMKGGRFFGELLAAEKCMKRKLHFAQFGQSTPYESEIRRGELKPGKEIFMPVEDESAQMYKALAYADSIIKSKKYNVVILDEINVALSMGYLKVADVLKLMLSKPKKVELILTGRNAPDPVMKAADYVSEIKMIKHPFNKKKNKLLGRRGIEY